QRYNDVLQASARYYGGKPIYGNLLSARAEMESGACRTLVFVSSRYELPESLLHTYEDLGAQVWQLRGVPESSPQLGHSEMAAAEYRRIMGNLPQDEQMTSVEDALSLREICAQCARAATSFVGR